MRNRLFLSLLFSGITVFSVAQSGENPSNAPSLFPVIQYDSTQITGCPAPIQSLGTSTSPYSTSGITGTMANDVWFKFLAVATVVKIKVCTPTTFDAGIEVWHSNASATDVTSRKDSINAFGSGAKEYKCVSGLTTGSTYFVRVGRVSGSGSGTFGLSIEHNKASVNLGVNPPSCYALTNSLTRFWLPVGTSTQWAFYQNEGGNLTLLSQVTGGTSISLGSVPGLCYQDTLSVFVQVSTNDSECGVVLWGYSTAVTIAMCNCPPVYIVAPACGSTVFFNSAFNASFQGTGVEYQWRFTSNGGNTQICTSWSTTYGVFNPSNVPAIANCLRYGQIYNIQVRARKAPCLDATCWSPNCIYFTPPMPLASVNLPGIQCGQYMSLNDGFITANIPLGADQVRFRFNPVNPCTSVAVGPSNVTPWGPNYVNPSLYMQTGNFYTVQAQYRINLVSNCVVCTGTTSVSTQQVDWSVPCLAGINTNNIPADGSSATAGCFDGGGNQDMSEQEGELDYNQRADNLLIVETATGMFIEIQAQDIWGNGDLTVFDLNGRVVFAQQLVDVQSQSTLQIDDMAKLSQGIYIIRMTVGNTVITQKIFMSGD